MHHVTMVLAWTMRGRKLHVRCIDSVPGSLNGNIVHHADEWWVKKGFPEPLVAPLLVAREGAIDMCVDDIPPMARIIPPNRLLDEIRCSMNRGGCPLPVDHGCFLKRWVQSNPFPRVMFTRESARSFIGATTGGFVGRSTKDTWDIKLAVETRSSSDVAFLIHGGDCFVPAHLTGLVPGARTTAVVVFPEGEWPVVVNSVVERIKSSYPHIMASFVKRLVSSPRTKQTTWDKAIEVLESTTGAIAALPGMSGLWGMGLDVITEATRARGFRSRVDLVQPLLGWIQHDDTK